ncbi:MAG: YdeI/OmpD-associated family protein, partial [Rubripirellula sp.]
GEAIELERQGRAVKSKPSKEMEYPDELNAILDQQPDLKDAFGRLTPGRRRGYLLHFTSAKQASTRINRIAKCRDRILAGKGWNER